MSFLWPPSMAATLWAVAKATSKIAPGDFLFFCCQLSTIS
ncbi:hypothetical protein BN2364_1310 [Alloalcanivorax xenomutans]|nr:hypothetical protein BN2364_1310 [Alloalcanivorax xenomutans]